MKIGDKLVIILLGPPGSGKGTQAILLAEKFDLYYFETSKILEEKFENSQRKEKIKIGKKEYSLFKEKTLWLKGHLCSPPFVTYLVKEKIKKSFKERKNLVLAGSPRTLYEAKEIMPLLEKLYGKQNIKIIFLDIPPSETILRNSNRKICKLRRHPIIFSKETKNLKFCPLDGSRLVKRGKLDKPKTIKTRILAFRKETFPILEFLEERGYKILKINGSPPPPFIFENILKKLKLK